MMVIKDRCAQSFEIRHWFTDDNIWNPEFENIDPPVNVLYMPSDVIGFGGRGTGFVTLLTNAIFSLKQTFTK